MGAYFIADPVQLNRLSTPIDLSKKIKQYGASNLYPQVVHNILQRSPLTKAAVKIMADFIKGDGFAAGFDTVLNRSGQTVNDVLSALANDLAEYRGFAVHYNYNAAGQIIEATPVPFEYCRLGLPNEKGFSKDIKVSNNWEYSNQVQDWENYIENIDTYPLVEFGKTYGQRGAIFYYSDLGPGNYPLCSYDPILDNAQSDAAIQLFEVNNLSNGFHSGTLWKHYGAFESERAKDRFLERINEMTGAKGAAANIVVEVDEALGNVDLIEPIPANNNDALFTQTTLNIRNRVLQYFNIPNAVMGTTNEGAVFQAAELGDSYTYMNLRTKNDRRILERFFNNLLPVGEIITNSFESSQAIDQAQPDPEPDPEPQTNEGPATTE